MLACRPVSLEHLLSKRLIVVVGKGGVGKTTVSAALSALLARRGRTTMLYQANAKEKLSTLFKGPVVGENVVKIRDRLFAVNTNPQAALHEYGLMVLRYETVYKMVFENRFAKALVRAIPGVEDYSMLGKLWWHTTEEDRGKPRWESIVFDAPATGHAVTMLRIPTSILEAVPEGPLTRDAGKVKALLTDPGKTAVVIVTLAEEMPTNESIELAARLEREVGMKATCVVVNQLYPPHFTEGSIATRVLDTISAGPVDDPALAPTVARARLARARRALNERYVAKIAADLPLPRLELPQLFVPSLGPADIDRLASMLEEQLKAESAAA